MNGWSLSRLMIDAKHQGEGYGRKALNLFIHTFAKLYDQEALYTSVSINNLNTLKLYESYGFTKTKKFEYVINGKTYQEYQLVLNAEKIMVHKNKL